MRILPSTIDRYLALRFIGAILTTFLFCALLIFMIDLVEILRQSGKFGRIDAWQVAWLTLLRLPAYTEFLIAFAVLVGSIATLLLLARKSELAVVRASGMSAWQFLRPGLVVAFSVGALGVLVYNPMAAAARAEGERLFAEYFGREANVLNTGAAGSWLRQDGLDGQSVLTAASALKGGTELNIVTMFVFDDKGIFRERVDAERAVLRDGYWELQSASVTAPGSEPEKFGTYLVSTYLSPERVADALGKVIAVSFWELPGLIEVAEKAKLSTAALEVQYELLLSRPFLCLAMVLLAATVSLKSFRSGGIQTMVVTGMVGGFGFFLFAEISRQIGVAGLVEPWIAVWMPVSLAILLTTTVLLHQEDG
ncbi:MAG: LPS export ABC transporter permease LptG [Hyphomicrobium sp.]|nr:LPS export ABC transporter permease LptG [Hyphomicrobium sp.]